MEYMTQDDKDRLEKELKDRTRKRRELSNRIGRAREMGDLKENAEYHAAREDQGMNEARIHDLKEKLSNVVIADTEVVPDDMSSLDQPSNSRDTPPALKRSTNLSAKSVGRSTQNSLKSLQTPHWAWDS